MHDDGTVTLVRQYRAAVDALVLEIPAGTRDKDGEEPPRRRPGASWPRRPGLEAAHWELLIGTWNTPGISDQHTLIFLATGLSPCPSRPDGVEEGYMTVETIHLDDVDALVADGTLKDETTVLGLYLARQRLAAADGRRRDGDAAPGRRGVPLLARGGAGALAAHPGGLPARPGGLPGRTSRRPRHRRRRRPADVAAHLAALRRTHGAASVARALSSIRGFHRFLVEEGLRGDDPTLDLPSISVTDLLPKALSEEETELLLGAVVGTGPAGPARPGPARGALRHGRPGQRGGRA